MSFIQPPFWSSPRRFGPPHAVSVLVTPSVPITASTVAAATVLSTPTPHHLVSGDTVAVLGHVGSTPVVDGSRVATVIDATHISIPVNVSIAGTGGTITRSTPVEPLTIAQGKLRAGLDWADGDARDVLMAGFISAARAKLEKDTGLAVLTQVRDVYFDRLPSVIDMPSHSMPLQEVVSIQSTDTAGVVNLLDPTNYVVDLVSGRVGLSLGGSWPSDLRPFQPFVMRIVSGWPSVAAIPPDLQHALGLLTAHYATVGRDLTTVGTIIATTPEGYDAVLAPYMPVSLT